MESGCRGQGFMTQDLFLESLSDLMGLKPYFKNKILEIEMQFLVP